MIQFVEHRIRQKEGIPQGSVIWPMLANLLHYVLDVSASMTRKGGGVTLSLRRRAVQGPVPEGADRFLEQLRE